MNRPSVALVGISAVGICLIISAWVYLHEGGRVSEAPAKSSAIPDKVSSGTSRSFENTKIPSSEKSGTEDRLLKRSAGPRSKTLQILDPGTLELSSEATEQLKLNHSQAKEVNRGIEVFKTNLFSQELSRAFVEVKANGDQEIVVPAFDRRPIHNALREHIAKYVAPELVSSIADLVAHDAELGASNTEIRVSFKTGADGRERLAYTRRVLSPDAYDPDIPIDKYLGVGARPDVPTRFSATQNIRTESLLTDTLKPRVKFLIDAAATLPKQSK